MTCCAGHCAAAGFFNRRIAERDLRRYQRRGPDTSTRMLLTELRRLPLQDLQLLDVGSGIGVIAAELAASGLAGAMLADASPAYLELARRNVGSRYGSRPTQFILGDFAATSAALPEADIVTLDRVVCCYPDAGALLSAAAARSRRLLAFTHPPRRCYLRAGFAVLNFFFWLSRNPFRIFVHSPQQMASVLEAAGFIRAAHRESFLWSFSLYRRPKVVPPAVLPL
jgi:magnesium-protoporphyrin O-methyltransferase